eukprot:SAG11_NODE_68_length_18649_cov_29.058005_17_plen_142_part_00
MVVSSLHIQPSLPLLRQVDRKFHCLGTADLNRGLATVLAHVDSAPSGATVPKAGAEVAGMSSSTTTTSGRSDTSNRTVVPAPLPPRPPPARQGFCRRSILQVARTFEGFAGAAYGLSPCQGCHSRHFPTHHCHSRHCHDRP